MPRLRRSRRPIALAAAAAILSLCANNKARAAAVPVEQVEPLDGNSAEYATYDFHNAATLTTGGITYHALAQASYPNTTQSTHADNVASEFYLTTPASAYVTDVYNDELNTFFTNNAKIQGTSVTNAPAPVLIGNGIRVLNNSWTGTYGVASVDNEAVMRLDYLTYNQNTLMVSAASTGTNASTLAWTAYNGLAVYSSLQNTFSPPTPNPGKNHADISVAGPIDVSYATGLVSGYATALIGNAEDSGFSHADHSQVIKSLLMTGADPTSNGWSDPNPSGSNTNHLNVTLGAGLANYNNSLSILNAGETTLNPAAASVVNATATTNTSGWAYSQSLANGDKLVVLNAINGIKNFDATLNWNVTQTSHSSGTIDTTAGGTIFPHIDLELMNLTSLGANNYLYNGVASTALQSFAPSDNVQHIYDPSDQLSPGYYGILVRGDPSLTENVGLSFSFTAVPEPAASSLLLLSLPLSLRRKRKSPRTSPPSRAT